MTSVWHTISYFFMSHREKKHFSAGWDGFEVLAVYSFLPLPVHSSQLWSRYHQSLRVVKLINKGWWQNKPWNQPKTAERSACVGNAKVSGKLMFPLRNNQFTWLEMHGKKQNKKAHKPEPSGAESLIFVTHILTWVHQGGFLESLKTTPKV